MAIAFLPVGTAGLTLKAMLWRFSDGAVWNGSAFVAASSVNGATLAGYELSVSTLATSDPTTLGYYLTIPAGAAATPCRVSFYTTSYTAGKSETYGVDYQPTIEVELVDGGRLDLILDDIDSEVDDIHIAVNAITVTGSALNVVCEADDTYTVVTTGNEGATTYANTYSNNNIRHEVAAVGGTIDTRYQFDIGSYGVPDAVIINAHFARNPAGGITMDLWAWNFVANDWEMVHANVLPAANTTTDGDYTANLFAHNVSGGKVRLRFYKTGVGTASLNIDQVFVSYAESVSASIALILADTNELQTDDIPGTIAALDGSTFDSIPDMATATAQTAAQNDLDTITDTGVALTSAERTTLATAILDLASAIDGKTLREAVRYIAAVAAGLIDDAGTGTETFVGLDGLTDRVQFTVDEDGNRSAVSYDP